MGKHHYGWMVAAVMSVGLFIAAADVARAAGEWEWTKEQGWIQGAGVSRPTPKEQLQYAYELEKRGEYMDSARQYFLLVQNFPASQEAGVGLQRLARCLFEMENYYTSYKAIEQVIETYPNTGRMSDLVEIELRIAKKMMVSQTPDLLSGRESNIRDFNIRRALEIVSSVIKHDPYGPVAAEAYLVKGEAHLFINEVQAARKAFETIRDEFPRSDYVERARLGILTCDSLMGQAKPQELADQIEVVREAERERMQRRRDADDETDEVEESIRQLAEVEAAKMMEQAKQYRTMGTRKTVGASEFLYKEVVRRYPGTPQAEEAMAFLGNLKMPKEPNRILKGFKNININPFTFNRDPEPPWIVPQMDPDDMVLVDHGLGPIAGVPETAAPRTTVAASVRPASLPNADLEVTGSSSVNFSPATNAPVEPAPSFIDGMPTQNYSQVPANLAYGPTMYGQQGGTLGSSPAPAPQWSSNPLPTVSESDLVGGGTGYGVTGYDSAGVYQPQNSYPVASTTYQGGYQNAYNPLPVPAQSPQPVLGSPDYNTPMTDLVGPAPRTSVTSAPIPDIGGAYVTGGYSGGGYEPEPYGSGGYYSPEPQPGSYYPAPAPTYVDPMYQQPAPAHQVPGSLQPSQPYGGTSNGGWTMGEDFR